MSQPSPAPRPPLPPMAATSDVCAVCIGAAWGPATLIEVPVSGIFRRQVRVGIDSQNAVIQAAITYRPLYIDNEEFWPAALTTVQGTRVCGRHSLRMLAGHG